MSAFFLGGISFNGDRNYNKYPFGLHARTEKIQK
jgi:hypothetical protein